MEEKIKTVLIASGSGTDANAIMKAYLHDCIPEIDLFSLISTKSEAKCLEKAESWGVRTEILNPKDFKKNVNFQMALGNYFLEKKIELVFLVGCIVKIYPQVGVKMYNIHPADPHKHGGDGMYGLDVHQHVLYEIFDQIERGKKKITDQFFTYPTIHEVEMAYDSGQPLLRADIEIPKSIIKDFVEDNPGSDAAVKALQKHVLPYEWIMLPGAVRLAAKKILDERSG